jgi:hypothetical protein
VALKFDHDVAVRDPYGEPDLARFRAGSFEEHQRRYVVPTAPIVFPSHLYPALAPLPAPMANHLLLLEERQYRRRPSKRPASQEMAKAVLERIDRARTLVYEYLRPFVAADRKRQQRGESRAFPNPEWLLETLAQYTPQPVRNSEATLDFWQKKGLLRREKTRGLLEITSVAALLIARLAEGNLQRSWLPSFLETTEPYWWWYGRVSPNAPIQAIPAPIPSTLPASLVVWTPWRGAIWENHWQSIEAEYLYRWAAAPTVQDLLVWEEDAPRKILAAQDDSLFGRPSVQAVLLQEASNDVLTRIVQKRMFHAGSIR